MVNANLTNSIRKLWFEQGEMTQLKLTQRVGCTRQTIQAIPGRPGLQEAANLGFHYNLIDRVADAFDFPVPEGVQKKRLAKMLNITGGMLKGSRAEEVWVRGEDGVIRPSEVGSGRYHLLTVGGATDQSTRKTHEPDQTDQQNPFVHRY